MKVKFTIDIEGSDLSIERDFEMTIPEGYRRTGSDIDFVENALTAFADDLFSMIEEYSLLNAVGLND